MISLLRSLGLVMLALVFGSPVSRADFVVDFEDLAVGTSGFYNGDSGIGTNSIGWSSGGAFFSNTFDASFGGFWSGWSYSVIGDTTTPGVGNQYASFPGGGANAAGGVDAGGTYAVASGDGAFVNLPSMTLAQSLRMANTTYAALAVRDGIDRNDGGQPFVTGPFGSMASISRPGYQASLDPGGNDFFRVTITGFDAPDATGNQTGSLTRYLADYRDDKSDNPDGVLFGGADYVLADWVEVDLTALGGARSFSLSFETTDIGTFGPNTPAYLAIDSLTVTAIPEPGTFAVIAAGFSVLGWRRLRPRWKSPCGAVIKGAAAG